MKLPWDDGHAVGIEEDSVFVRGADVLVGNGIRRASTFECD
jgi:hypothetical protein